MVMARGLAMTVVMAMAVLLSCALTVTAQPPGQCNPDFTCPDPTDCCSQFDFCGKGPQFCGPGCQGGPCDFFSPASGGGGTAQGECNPDSTCPDPDDCCSQFGFCGTGPPYCGPGCQSGPCDSFSTASGGGGLSDILTRSLYENFFPGHLAFYSYDKLLEAAKLFPQFGTTGDLNTRKREIAAFAAHVTHETSGLKKIVEQTNDPYCDSQRPEFSCNGKHFNGRGPLQLSWNYNYGTCGNYLNIDLLHNPDLVATDALISFKCSLWFWNQYGDSVIPHIHAVMTGKWQPSNNDKAANRVPGFGVTIVVINGGLECNKQSNLADARVMYYKNFCSRLGVSPGDNVDCKKMKPFYSLTLDAEA